VNVAGRICTAMGVASEIDWWLLFRPLIERRHSSQPRALGKKKYVQRSMEKSKAQKLADLEINSLCAMLAEQHNYFFMIFFNGN